MVRDQPTASPFRQSRSVNPVNPVNSVNPVYLTYFGDVAGGANNFSSTGKFRLISVKVRVQLR